MTNLAAMLTEMHNIECEAYRMKEAIVERIKPIFKTNKKMAEIDASEIDEIEIVGDTLRIYFHWYGEDRYDDSVSFPLEALTDDASMQKYIVDAIDIEAEKRRVEAENRRLQLENAERATLARLLKKFPQDVDDISNS